jgi:hypothetical protein
MALERRRQVAEAFEAALEVDTKQRSAILAKLNSEDPLSVAKGRLAYVEQRSAVAALQTSCHHYPGRCARTASMLSR